MENSSDDILSRVLGDTMQTATLRMAIYVVIASAVAATIVALI